MILKGKCEISFKEWYKSLKLKIPYVINEDGEKDYWDLEYNHVFKNLPDNMKYGVYEDFFDSVGIEIDDIFAYEMYLENHYNEGHPGPTYLRPLARTAAIEKANQIFNER